MSQPFDGQAEYNATLARLSTLCGGRVMAEVPDDAALPANTDGTVKPFIVLLRGQPTPTAQDRGLGGERVQPHILLLSAVVEAASATVAEPVVAAILDLLLDWQPSATASGFKVFSSDSFPVVASGTVPSRRIVTTRFTTTINL